MQSDIRIPKFSLLRNPPFLFKHPPKVIGVSRQAKYPHRNEKCHVVESQAANLLRVPMAAGIYVFKDASFSILTKMYGNGEVCRKTVGGVGYGTMEAEGVLPNAQLSSWNFYSEQSCT